tara:strand:+ start:731 stop:838 length:108 start_codon:yes stop_codon:yes gene_type:complete
MEKLMTIKNWFMALDKKKKIGIAVVAVIIIVALVA